MVNLKANPYYLDDGDIRWVEETIAAMTDAEKVGQLFFQLTQSPEEDYIKDSTMYVATTTNDNHVVTFEDNEIYADDIKIDEVYKAIKDVYEKENYLMDTHTAVGYVVLKKYHPSCIFCGKLDENIEYNGFSVCKECVERLSDKVKID